MNRLRFLFVRPFFCPASGIVTYIIPLSFKILLVTDNVLYIRTLKNILSDIPVAKTLKGRYDMRQHLIRRGRRLRRPLVFVGKLIRIKNNYRMNMVRHYNILFYFYARNIFARQ